MQQNKRKQNLHLDSHLHFTSIFLLYCQQAVCSNFKFLQCPRRPEWKLCNQKYWFKSYIQLKHQTEFFQFENPCFCSYYLHFTGKLFQRQMQVSEFKYLLILVKYSVNCLVQLVYLHECAQGHIYIQKMPLTPDFKSTFLTENLIFCCCTN